MTCAAPSFKDPCTLWCQLTPAQRSMLEAVRDAGAAGYLLALPRGRTARVLRDDLGLIERYGAAPGTPSKSSQMVLTALGARVAAPPIVFLDQDGVLSRVLPNKYASAYERIDPAAVGRLNRIVRTTGARFVSSSTWREGQTPSAAARFIENALCQHGFVGKVISATPVLDHGRRGEEIQTWLDAQLVQPRAFAILDDWQPMGPLLEARTVYTDERVLLTDKDVDKVIALLTTPTSQRRTQAAQGPAAPAGAT